MTPLAAIHVAKKQLGLDDDTYRAVLARVTGKSSAKLMSTVEQRMVLAELNRQGFKPSKKSLEGPFTKKLQALWIAAWNLGLVADRSDAAMVTFIKRQTGIEAARFLRDAADARKVVEALKAWTARDGGVDWSDGSFRPAWHKRPGAKIAIAQWAILTRAGLVEADGFVSFVAEHAFRRIDDMSPLEWAGIMNRLGEQVRRTAI